MPNDNSARDHSSSNQAPDAAIEAFSSDRPISLPAEDRLNRLPFAKRIVNALVNRTDQSGLVIGLYGRWGDGKTSVLNLVGAEVQKKDQFIVVRFNPWMFGDQTQLLTAFFATMADSLGRKLKASKETIGDLLSKYSFALAPIKPLGLDLSAFAKEFGESLSSVQLEERRKRLESILRDSEKRIVVIIDDVDRLDRTEIQAIFKLVKLSADFDLITYVLAFDDEMVAKALGEKYAEGSSDAGRAFLEKIIQVPLHLPPADSLALRDALLQSVDRVLQSNGVVLTDEEVQRFLRCFNEGLQSRLTTPRMVSRYTNAIEFAVPLLYGEANMVDCLLVEGIRIFYPTLYSTIRTSAQAFLGVTSARQNENWKVQAKKIVEEALGDLDSVDADSARELIQALFPQTKSIFGSFNFSETLEERLEKQQRVSASNYFWRYFQYAVPLRDISDRKIQEFIETLQTDSIENVRLQISELGAGQRIERLIEKLREREKSLEPVGAANLALALAGSGRDFPKPESFYPFSSPFSQAAILIFNLVRRWTFGSQRDELASRVIDQSNPTSFAVEILQWFQKRSDQDESERVLSDGFDVILAGRIAKRIPEEAARTPPHISDPKGAPRLFNMWYAYGDKDSLKSYLSNRFETDPREAAKFISCYLPTVWSGATGLPSKGEISREAYEFVKNLVEPDKMIGYLRRTYGESLSEDAFLENRRQDVEATAAATFYKTHQFVQAEKSTAPRADPEATNA
jgi:hypothetical protein